MSGGGNCSIAGGVQLTRLGLKVGTPCLFKPVDVGVVASMGVSSVTSLKEKEISLRNETSFFIIKSSPFHMCLR
jgi:hypothetical protein